MAKSIFFSWQQGLAGWTRVSVVVGPIPITAFVVIAESNLSIFFLSSPISILVFDNRQLKSISISSLRLTG